MTSPSVVFSSTSTLLKNTRMDPRWRERSRGSNDLMASFCFFLASFSVSRTIIVAKRSLSEKRTCFNFSHKCKHCTTVPINVFFPTITAQKHDWCEWINECEKCSNWILHPRYYLLAYFFVITIWWCYTAFYMPETEGVIWNCSTSMHDQNWLPLRKQSPTRYVTTWKNIHLQFIQILIV